MAKISKKNNDHETIISVEKKEKRQKNGESISGERRRSEKKKKISAKEISGEEKANSKAKISGEKYRQYEAWQSNGIEKNSGE